MESISPRRSRASRWKGFAAATVGGALFISTAFVGVVAPAAAAVPASGYQNGIGGITLPTTDFTPGRYIVTLADEAAASYTGGVDGLKATKAKAGTQLDTRAAPVEKYTDYLGDQQKDVAASVGADIEYSYTYTLNAFSAELSTAQATKLASDHSVASVVKDEIVHPTAAEPSTDFLGLSGDNGVWSTLGGIEKAGKGVVVGDIDTGIAPENASFAGDPLGTSAGAQPYLDGSTIVFDKADGSAFHGTCVTGEAFTADDCSTKIVGARYFLDGFGAGNIGNASTGEYVSPRDGDGHGSHTASTAAGNHDVPVVVNGQDFGKISGVAPAAKIAAYKVCWSGPDNTVTTDDGCANSDILAAIDQAVADGVDVINFSIGGGAAQTTVSLSDQAFFNAAAAGIFVSASAGNSGPGASTLDNASPWITTVAASTIPSYEATATFGDGKAVAGASVTVYDPITGPLVRADLVAVAGHDPADALLCAADSLDPAKVAGTIVLCQRGVYDRVAKSEEVKRAGGIGMLLVNKTPGSIDTDVHAVPTVHLSDASWQYAYDYAATPGATVTFTPENTTDYEPPVPQVAGFSSRGPVLADGSDILKPDISAPGVSILAAGANAAGEAGSYEFLSGTSMAAPHITGLAALYLGAHPNASTSEVKSAMMTTAYNTLDADGAEVTDPYAQGAGQVDPTRYLDPGMLYLNGVGDWLSYIQGIGYDVGAEPVDATELNQASIAIGALTGSETVTRTVTSTGAGSYTARPVDIPGIDAVVSPSELSFDAAGQTATYTVTFTRTDAPLDAWATGALDWVSTTDAAQVVHSPVAVYPVAIVAPESVAGTGVAGSVDVSVTPGADGEIPLTTSGLAAGVHQPNPADATDPHSGSGVKGDVVDYEVVVPEGVEVARFDLNSVDDTPATDLDLTVFQLDAAGNAVASFASATASADERVDIPAPDAATYVVEVSVFSGTTAWDVTTFSVLPGAGEGGLTVAPTPLAGVQGQPVTYTASWSGLTPQTDYLGVVHYGDTGRSTLLEVAAGEAPAPGAPVNTVAPTINGTPKVGKKLTADAGTWDTEGLTFGYQWQRDGVAIEGATAQKYRVVAADQGTTLTVLVTASITGRPDGSATSTGVFVPYAATVSLNLSTPVAFSWSTVKATVRVASDGVVAGQSVTVTVGKKTVTGVLDGNGRVSLTLPKLRGGIYPVTASFAGTDEVSAAKSQTRHLVIIF